MIYLDPDKALKWADRVTLAVITLGMLALAVGLCYGGYWVLKQMIAAARVVM